MEVGNTFKISGKAATFLDLCYLLWHIIIHEEQEEGRQCG